jgi:excisionase family DNA binding protein
MRNVRRKRRKPIGPCYSLFLADSKTRDLKDCSDQRTNSLMPTKLISTDEAAKRNEISARYVQRLCADRRIKGAQQFGRTWLIPAGFKWKALPRGPKPR